MPEYEGAGGWDLREPSATSACGDFVARPGASIVFRAVRAVLACGRRRARDGGLLHRKVIRWRHLSLWVVALLQPACSPSLVPLFAACFAELGSPLAEDAFPESDEVAVLWVVRIRETPWKLAADDIRLVWIRRDDAQWEEWRLCILLVDRCGYRRWLAAVVPSCARWGCRR